MVRYLPKYYRFPSLGAYNALLSLFNITAERVSGAMQGQIKSGLVYFALNEQGEKCSHPFKAYLFGKQAGMEALQRQFELNKAGLKKHPSKAILKNSIEAAMHSSNSEKEFKDQLKKQGINTIVRRNDEGRIYGVTFIDHPSKTVWNGSDLGKELSANACNERWNRHDANVEDTAIKMLQSVTEGNTTQPEEKLHGLFDFLNADQISERQEAGLIEGLVALLPEAQGVDVEELVFERKVKRRKKGNKGKRR